MKIVSSSDLRKSLKEYLEQLEHNHEPIIVTRKNAQPAVLLSMEDYTALDETEYLLSSPANAERLLESITELREGKGKVRKLPKNDQT